MWMYKNVEEEEDVRTRYSFQGNKTGGNRNSFCNGDAKNRIKIGIKKNHYLRERSGFWLSKNLAEWFGTLFPIIHNEEDVIFDWQLVKSLLEQFLDFKIEVAGFKSNRNFSHKEHIALVYIHTSIYTPFIVCNALLLFR